METVPTPAEEPPATPGREDYPGDEVREPPLPGEHEKIDFPRKDP